MALALTGVHAQNNLPALAGKSLNKQDEEAMANMKNALMNSEGFEVPLRLGELDTSIRFVETHYHDIKTIIEASIQDNS